MYIVREYFVAKPIARELPLNVWNRFYHDHEVEIATGRVQVLDMPEDQAKDVAAAPQDRRHHFSSLAEGISGADRRSRSSPIRGP